MDKHEIIKDYVLKDRDSFSLAVDIYSSFDGIKNILLESVYRFLYSQIKFEISNANISHYTYVNNQHINILYSDKVTIQIDFRNYFRQPSLNIYGVDKDLAEEISGIIQPTTNSGDKIQLTINEYSFNKITEILGLYDLYYDLYNDGTRKKELKDNFYNYVLIPVKKIYDAIDNYHKKVSQ